MHSEDELFDRFYNPVLASLEARRESDAFDEKEIRGELEALYIYQGHDWTGRGFMKDLEIEAQISAYQVFLNRLGTEKSNT